MKHIKNIVVGTLENELIFQKFFGIIYTGNEEIFSPFFKVPIFSGVVSGLPLPFAGLVSAASIPAFQAGGAGSNPVSRSITQYRKIV